MNYSLMSGPKSYMNSYEKKDIYPTCEKGFMNI